MKTFKKILTGGLAVLFMLCADVSFSACDGSDGEPFDGSQETTFFDAIGALEQTDIQKIETVEYAGDIAPNHRDPTAYKTSALAADIEAVYTWLKSLQNALSKIDDKDVRLDGAGSKTFTIYLPENYFSISDVGRNYLKIGNDFYAQAHETPEITGETTTYRFESYSDDATLYINDEKAKDYDFDFGGLVCTESDFTQSVSPYRLSTSIGELYLHDEKHFIRNDVAYEIVGDLDFSQIFAEFPATKR